MSSFLVNIFLHLLLERWAESVLILYAPKSLYKFSLLVSIDFSDNKLGEPV